MHQWLEKNLQTLIYSMAFSFGIPPTPHPISKLSVRCSFRFCFLLVISSISDRNLVDRIFENGNEYAASNYAVRNVPSAFARQVASSNALVCIATVQLL